MLMCSRVESLDLSTLVLSLISLSLMALTYLYTDTSTIQMYVSSVVHFDDMIMPQLNYLFYC